MSDEWDRMVKRMRRRPGSWWRVLAPGFDWRSAAYSDDRPNDGHPHAGDVVFDELVIDDWLHIEQMDTRAWWMNLGGYHIWIRVPKHGPVEVSHDGKTFAQLGMRSDE